MFCCYEGCSILLAAQGALFCLRPSGTGLQARSIYTGLQARSH